MLEPQRLLISSAIYVEIQTDWIPSEGALGWFADWGLFISKSLQIFFHGSIA
jgi:hypothetical protein